MIRTLTSSCSLAMAVSLGLALSALTGVSTATAADPTTIDVRLASGREMTGAVDPRTGAKQLWLRVDRPGIQLTRPIDWARVVSATAGGEKLSGEQLQARAKQLVQPAPGRRAAQPSPTRRATQQPAARIRSLRADAVATNFDADHAFDGLRLIVEPLDGGGRRVAVGGRIDVSLFADVRRRFHEAPRSRGSVRERIAHWSIWVSPARIGQPVNLHYSASPHEDDRVDGRGEALVRFSAPGQSTVEARIRFIDLR
jgi:hypothetical protein